MKKKKENGTGIRDCEDKRDERIGIWSIEHRPCLSGASSCKADETLSSRAYSRNCGGKALNQSIALAQAGLSPFLAGAVGMDGRFLLDLLIREGGGYKICPLL